MYLNLINVLGKIGVTTVAEATRHLNAYVENEMGGARVESHQHIPTEKDISNILYTVKAGLKKSPRDQLDVQAKYREWLKEGDRCYLRVSA